MDRIIEPTSELDRYPRLGRPAIPAAMESRGAAEAHGGEFDVRFGEREISLTAAR
jgi:hypothetical protein